MSNERKRPERAITFNVEIGADDWQEVVRALDSLSFCVGRGDWRKGGVSGGCGSGYIVTVIERDVSPEQYQAALRAYLDAEPKP